MAKMGLYLGGGGARGAYQAGALKAISELLKTKYLPFNVISGVSVGSINASVLTQHADDFPLAVDMLETLWQEIRCQDIFNASSYELGKSVARNLGLVLVKQQQSGFLLDTAPLHQFIDTHIDFKKIALNIQNNHVETMEVISTCYETQQTISFYEHSKPTFEDWHYPKHRSKRVALAREHILSSSALPLFFPSIKIDHLHYGDGSVGLVSPLRGVLRCNVDKILILGTRQAPFFPDEQHLKNDTIGFANILGNMMNGVFLDNLDRDIEMVNRMNDIAQLISMWKKHRSPWRPIQTLHLRPSEDVAQIAQSNYQTMPTLLRYLLNMLGAQKHSGDLLSFLLFEQSFTRELIDLGYQDTIAAADKILRFFG